MYFEWDANKAESNLKKHGVSFNEATEAFYDPDAIANRDIEHSDEEQRFYLIGFSSRRLLFIIYAERNAAGETIRIISARKAERTRQLEYYAANFNRDTN